MKKEGNICLCLTIAANEAALDAIGDFCLGMFEAAVEQSVDAPLLRVFLECQAGEESTIVARLENYGRELAGFMDIAPPRIDMEILPDQDWGSRWKEHFHPFTLTPGLVIAPTWEQYAARPGEKVIVMDPGMAFGTGHHATTAMAATLTITAVEEGAATVLDVGCGTGILAMTAALFGAKRVMAIDNDSLAVEAARHNILANNLAKQLVAGNDDIADLPGVFQLVIANIIHDVLVALAADLSRLTAPGGVLIVSGILVGEQEESIFKQFRSHGFTPRDRHHQGEWAALRLDKKVS
ncbi:MAG: 50S ribosomal protein L11 methyltransferase [Desulfobulbaceae bacterium]|nr:50S ribosomal protein L11 methyltransferase [Desulfobulbaceae bacterium]